jgi:hypothetical protein
MSMTRDEILLLGAFAPARSLEPSPAEVAAVLRRAAGGPPAPGRRAGRGRSRGMAAALASLLLLLGVAYAVPPTRAAIDDAAESIGGIFDGWGSGDSGGGPGRALGSDEPAPNYFREGAWSEVHVQDPRVIAEAGGYRLFAYRERNGTIGFDLGDTGVGMGGYHASDFDGRAICLLGPGTTDDTDPTGPRPFFGVTAPDVGKVELGFASGPSETVDVEGGGFVLLLDRGREPTTIAALDADGGRIGTATIEAAAAYC